MCARYEQLVTTPSAAITDAASISDLAWLVEQALTRDAGISSVLTWAAYNSALAAPADQLTTVAMMPLLAAPAHKWNTMLTILKQEQKITTVVMEEGH